MTYHNTSFSTKAKPVIQIGDDVVISAGSIHSAPADADLVIDLANSSTVTSHVVSSPTIPELEIKRDIIKVAWSDFGVPPMKREWWEKLVEKLMSGKWKRIYIGCSAGLGRTGTALSILVGLMGLSETPITFVREHYDSMAVETQGQIDYVAKITGFKENVGVSKGKFIGYSTGSYAGVSDSSKKPDEATLKAVKKALEPYPSVTIDSSGYNILLSGPGSALSIYAYGSGPNTMRYLDVLIDGKFIEVAKQTGGIKSLLESFVIPWAKAMEKINDKLKELGVSRECFDLEFVNYGIFSAQQIREGADAEVAIKEFLNDKEIAAVKQNCAEVESAMGLDMPVDDGVF